MKRKFLVTLILFLFLLPFVSWYYLRSGLAWRKEAQAAMSGTALFPQVPLVDHDAKTWPAEVTRDHVSLISYVPCGQDAAWTGLVTQLYDQFKETGKANLILLDTCSVPGQVPGDSWKKTYHIRCAASASLCTDLEAEWPSGASFALVDRNQVIRAYYPAASVEEKRILLEHMALLLPRERSEKVELRRGQQQ